ncbi:phosphoribosyltransferase [Natrarchaeobius oligotrophus]|uniref:Phosphoribosyltransferase n=1 Tax=Natrarchaeobius chitinivorans TaxID=1679083 RepID=A0A3N6MXD2_NATCH|nr:phosphoribosyltransferase family protein [Natrarchaeobius chitinivorans]RQH02681.1 phosphoribosyltransferase [Natrarchaeobius chitinivorans]
MAGVRQFADRTDAGKRLGQALRERGIDADIVLAVPRGGLPLGRAVADALEAPLDVVVAKKIGAPGNPEYAVGAVASDGSAWRNERAINGTRTDEGYFQERREIEAENAHRKAERYRVGRPAPDLGGKTVVVVDDGVATGSTLRACLSKLERSDAERIVLAVPVGPPDTIADLEAQVDEVVCLETPAAFRGVGQFYADFGQVSDDEAMSYLEP